MGGFVTVRILGVVGRGILNSLYSFWQVVILLYEIFRWLFVQPLRGRGLRIRSALDHYVEFGLHSLPIVGLISFLVGAIMAMQTANQLRRFGAMQYIANLVGVAAMRELAPLMTAILVTGRSGSAITAEIGAMRIAEEIDALEVMGINPIKFLVVPKFLGMLIAVPCLTILAVCIMIAGGFVLSVFVIEIDPIQYLTNTFDAIKMKDFVTGMTKSVFFGIVICLVGVYRGFQVEGGAEGVGKMTTSSVVTSIFFIILVDLVFTAMFFS